MPVKKKPTEGGEEKKTTKKSSSGQRPSKGSQSNRTGKHKLHDRIKHLEKHPNDKQAYDKIQASAHYKEYKPSSMPAPKVKPNRNCRAKWRKGLDNGHVASLRKALDLPKATAKEVLTLAGKHRTKPSTDKQE